MSHCALHAFHVAPTVTCTRCGLLARDCGACSVCVEKMQYGARWHRRCVHRQCRICRQMQQAATALMAISRGRWSA